MTGSHSTVAFRRGAIALRVVVALVAALDIMGGVFAFNRTLCCAPPTVTVEAPPAARPADFVLDFTAQTGSVSPQYFHRWRLQVALDGEARKTYVPG